MTKTAVKLVNELMTTKSLTEPPPPAAVELERVREWCGQRVREWCGQRVREWCGQSEGEEWTESEGVVWTESEGVVWTESEGEEWTESEGVVNLFPLQSMVVEGVAPCGDPQGKLI
ncbi:hypothetical protein Pmani_030330 [Petrolisthes manimaculis]|uniref:Uncharacterized protein n=1 Tax=Petrolisthes manimaculis TaxID=1843537 RepID=A0AAE1NY75_9EUCA|nr:hypothetical protein Pmani_030330 [Petrolisthes manimaculis]